MFENMISEFCNQFDYEFGQIEPDAPEYCYYKFKAENHGYVGFPDFYANSPLELAQKMLGWKSAPYPTLMEHYEKTEKWKNKTIKELEDYYTKEDEEMEL